MKYWLFLAVLLPSLCFGQTVDAPSVAKRDRPIKINHPEGAKVAAIFADVSSGVVSWKFVPDEHFERTPTYTIFAAPPGDYLITDGRSTILRILEETVPPSPDPPRPAPNPDPKPEPEPKPDPEPKPSPVPKIKVRWAVWIYEQADSILQIPETNTRLSTETRKLLDDKGIAFAAYDADQEAAKAGPFRDVASKLPALVLMEDSQKYSIHPAPKTVAALKELLKEVAGE